MNKAKELKSLLMNAQEFAWLAGKLTLKYFQTELKTQIKPDETPVTEADFETEKLLRHLIEKKYPNHGVIGEEWGVIHSNSPFKWIIDPIDGTVSFARGIPLYGVLIALTYEDEPLLGVVNLPALNEMIAAGKGLGCTLNGRRCFVSQQKELSKSTLFTDLTYCENSKQSYPKAYTLGDKVDSHRNWGNCFGYTSIATGRAEVAVSMEMKPWDNGPMISILEEAGGVFTSWTNERTLFAENVVASNGFLHEEALSYLQSIDNEV